MRIGARLMLGSYIFALILDIVLTVLTYRIGWWFWWVWLACAGLTVVIIGLFLRVHCLERPQ